MTGVPMRPHRLAGWPLLTLSVAPKTPKDRENMAGFLAMLHEVDPTYLVSSDPETGRTVLQADTAQQADVWRLMFKRTYKVEADIGPPQIAYREALTRSAEIDHTFKRQMGSNGQFARVRLMFEQGAPDTGLVFRSDIIGDAVPEAFVPGVARGIETARQKGLLRGYPVIDVRATLVDGAFHDIDSSAATFEIAACEAFGQLREKAGPVVVEPMMLTEVMLPKVWMKAFLSDLRRRRGRVVTQRAFKTYEIMDTVAPLSNLFGYFDALREISENADILYQSYDHYAPVPAETPPDGVFPPAVGMRAQINASIAGVAAWIKRGSS